MKDYYQLTQWGKARRLRQLAIKALSAYDLDVLQVRLITNDQNGIFRVDTYDKQKYILRVVIPDAGHTVDELNAEMTFLNALKDSDISAPIPLETKSGDWISTAEVEGVPQPRHCNVFTWVDGVDLAEKRSPETWFRFGALSAQLHDFAQSFTPQLDFSLPTFDTPFPYKEECVLFDDTHRKYFSDEAYELLQLAFDKIQADIDSLFQDTSGLRVIHGDLHQWNVRIARGKLSPIDFEDLLWGYPIQDIATTLYYNRYDDDYDVLLEQFKRGYATVLPFPEAYDGQLETHMLSRRIGLLNYVFNAEEEDIEEFPNFIPLTVERIQYVKARFWDSHN